MRKGWKTIVPACVLFGVLVGETIFLAQKEYRKSVEKVCRIVKYKYPEKVKSYSMLHLNNDDALDYRLFLKDGKTQLDFVSRYGLRE